MQRLLVVSVTLALAGCSGGGDAPAVMDDWADAPKRFADESDSEHETSYTFRLGDAQPRLTVKAHYDTHGKASFVLKDPNGNGRRIETFDEARTLRSETWFQDADPVKGTWALSVHLTEGGAYAFGVYYR